MKLRRLLVSSELFLQLFTAGEHPAFRVIRDAVPEDAKLWTVVWAIARHQSDARELPAIELLISSASFDEVKEGDVIPEITPIMERVLPAA